MNPVLHASIIGDIHQLHDDIHIALTTDLTAQNHIQWLSKPSLIDSCWSLSADGLLCLDNCIYVPDSGQLQLQVLQLKHDHVLARHPGQNKTLELIRCDYTWPQLRTSIQDYCKSCVICMRSKPQRHKPYGTLQQLPIPD